MLKRSAEVVVEIVRVKYRYRNKGDDGVIYTVGGGDDVAITFSVGGWR